MQTKNFQTFMLQALLSAALVGVGCARDNKSDSPPPPAQPKPAEEKSKTEQNQTAQKDQKSGGLVTDRDRQVAKSSTGTSAIPNAAEMRRTLDAQSDAEVLFARMLMEPHPDEIEHARTRLVDEIFTDEGSAPVKIMSLQAAVAKLNNAGLYGTQAKARVDSLRTQLNERYKDEQYSDILQKGAIFAASSFLVLGPVAAAGAYRHVPELGTKMRQGVDATRTAWRENVSEKLGPKFREYKENLTNPVRRREMSERVANRGRQIRDDAVGAVTPRSTETVLRENLEQLGVSTRSPEAINEVQVIQSHEIPELANFTTTARGDLRFAIVDHWHGEDLGLDRRIVFRQGRLFRQVIETNYVTNRMPEDVARGIGERIAAREGAAAETQFVNVIHPETGAVTSSSMRWSRFKELLATAQAGYTPLFLSPTSLGVGATTTAAAGLSYWWGYDKGHTYGQVASAMDLEALIPPKAAPQPGIPATSLRASAQERPK